MVLNIGLPRIQGSPVGLLSQPVDLGEHISFFAFPHQGFSPLDVMIHLLVQHHAGAGIHPVGKSKQHILGKNFPLTDKAQPVLPDQLPPENMGPGFPSQSVIQKILQQEIHPLLFRGNPDPAGLKADFFNQGPGGVLLDHAEGHPIAAIFLHHRHHGFQQVGGYIVVAVHKADVRSPGQLQSRVPGGGQAAVFLVDHPDPAVRLAAAVADGGAVIRGAVIHQDQLKIPTGLG